MLLDNGNGCKAQLNREDFARAWATGDEWERGRMIFDLNKQGSEAKRMVKQHLTYIYGGLTVAFALAGVILKFIFGG